MDLPPLPDIFGNYAIRGIVEVLSPGPVSWLPVTTGWKLLFALVLLALGRSGWRYWQRWRRNRYRSAALAELQYYRDEALNTQLRLGGIAALLKATALQAYPRRDIASLSGGNWLQWLDASSDSNIFSESSRTLLQESLYRDSGTLNPAAINQLCDESAAWIRGHREPENA